MQRKGFRTSLSALFGLTFFLGKLHAFPAQFPAQGDDVTPSLGQFRILVSPVFQTMMAGDPNYNATPHILTSPLLCDPTTIIGLSNVLLDGSANAAAGVPVGSADTTVSESNLTVQPGGLAPVNTREIHTEIRSLKMTDFAGSVAAVRAGTNTPGRPIRAGEVQSRFGACGNWNCAKISGLNWSPQPKALRIICRELSKHDYLQSLFQVALKSPLVAPSISIRNSYYFY